MLTSEDQHRLGDSWSGDLHEFAIIDHDGREMHCQIKYGFDAEGVLREVQVHAGKSGTQLHGLLRALSIAISIGLQFDIPFEMYADKFRYMYFMPHVLGKEGHQPKSIVDYLAWYTAELERKRKDARGT